MSLPDLLIPLRGVPWARNASLTGQLVWEHLFDDPLQLVLQGSRRLPADWRPPLGAVLRAAAGAGGLGAVGAAVSLEMQGRTEEALRSVSETHRAEVARADAALLLGDEALAHRLLEGVDPRERGAAWHAARSRLAHHQGDLSAAASLAASHPRLRALHRRMDGERAVFTTVPRLAPVTGYRPAPGRVLHVLTNSLPHTGSGYAQRSHSILLALRGAGVEVSAVTRPGYPAQVGVPWARQEDVVDGISYRRLTPWRLAQGQASRVAQHARLLAAEVARTRPEALHTTTHFVNALAVRAVAEAFGIPWVYEVRGQLADTWAAKRGPEAVDSQRYRAFVAAERSASLAADAVVTLGGSMAARLHDQGVPEDSVMLAPNAVDARFLDAPPTRSEARKRLGLFEEHVWVGTVSSLVDYEGLDTLLRAAALLAPREPKLRVSIAGDGVSLPRLRSLAAELGISHLCRFPGRVRRDEALWEHVSLDVFCVPRRDLPVTRAVTPMKSVEASAVGTPVLASDLPALAELVEDGVTGRLVRAEDPQAWAAALSELVSDAGLRARFGAAGRDWAARTRTWEANAQRYLDLYRRLGVSLPT